MKVIVNQLKVDHTVFHIEILIGVNNFKGSMHLLIINSYNDFFQLYCSWLLLRACVSS